MALPRTLRTEDLPIPTDSQPNSSWSPLMLELAAHVGAFATLLIVDAFPGRDVYVPVDASLNPFREIIGAENAAIISHVFGLERLQIPTGRAALLRARRAPVLAAVRSKKMTVGEAASILGTPRRYVSLLVNQTTQGTDAEPVILPARPRDHRQLEMFIPDGDLSMN